MSVDNNSEYWCRKEEQTMAPKTNYYQVTAKCGHVGRGMYVPINFAVKAMSASEAAQKAKGFPRVKKQLWDCIIAVIQITKREYKRLIKSNRKDPYLNAKCSKECPDMEGRIERLIRSVQRRKHEPAKSMKYRKALYELGGRRNSLNICYGED